MVWYRKRVTEGTDGREWWIRIALYRDNMQMWQNATAKYTFDKTKMEKCHYLHMPILPSFGAKNFVNIVKMLVFEIK